MLRRYHRGNMTLRTAVLGAVLLVSPAIAGDEAGRAKLMGSWRAADGGKDAVGWAFQDKGGTLHVVNSKGATVLVEFECDLLGHDCIIKDGGRPATVSLWFAGPKLVEMETKGSSVWKRTFGIGQDSDSMDLEVVQIVPAPKTEIQHFKRETAAPETR